MPCRHRSWSTWNVRVKKILKCHSSKKIFFYKYIILAILPWEQTKLLALSSASFCCCSCCFEFSAALSRQKNCAALSRQKNWWTASAAAISNTNDEENFKFELTFKKLRKYIFTSYNKDCVILNVHYRLCFTKVFGMGGIFDKNSSILGMRYSFLESTCFSL